MAPAARRRVYSVRIFLLEVVSKGNGFVAFIHVGSLVESPTAGLPNWIMSICTVKQYIFLMVQISPLSKEFEDWQVGFEIWRGQLSLVGQLLVKKN
mmetsp:Transcript_14862/g.25204  ORF Transcript_14862/g.25204 Transcript_14862/m.25204 type:complete len:96 (+) Transcript_14862:139-426(+)